MKQKSEISPREHCCFGPKIKNNLSFPFYFFRVEKCHFGQTKYLLFPKTVTLRRILESHLFVFVVFDGLLQSLDSKRVLGKM